MRRSLASWLPLLVTPFLALTLESTGRAAPITYTTSGWVGSQSGSQGIDLSYNPTSGTLTIPGTMALGSIAAQALPTGLGLTYEHLPFEIDATFQTQGSSGPETSTLKLQGEINGAIMGTTSSTAVATVTSVQATGPGTLPFPVSSFDFGAQAIAASGVNGGITPLSGQVSTVPEPTPLAIVALLAGWAAFRSRVRRQAAVTP
jgi:hypothetical protein